MDGGGEMLRRLGDHFAAALGEVGTQLKHHAKQASREIGFDLDSLQYPFCGNLNIPLNEVQCSLFTLPGTNASKKTRIKISGNFEFNFDVKFHPQEIGVIIAMVKGVDESSCTFKWKRAHASYEVDIDTSSSNQYTLTADDIGTTLIVKCTHSGGKGTAIGEIGPFDVDVHSRRLIQDALINGTARHELFLEDKISLDKKNTEKSTVFVRDDCLVPVQQRFIIYILSEQLVLQSDDTDVNIESNYNYSDENLMRCRYSSAFPRVRLCSENPLRMFLRLNQQDELRLRVFSRQQRDLIALTIRAFHSRMLISNALENNSLEVLRDGRLQDPTNGGRRLDVVCALQKMSDYLSVSLEESNCLRLELERCKREKSFLEAEIENTISVFQQHLTDCDNNKKTSKDSPSDNNERNEMFCAELIGRNVTLAEKMAVLNQEKVKLESELDTLKGERNRLEKHSKSLKKDLERVHLENMQLKNDIDELKAKIRKLAISP